MFRRQRIRTSTVVGALTALVWLLTAMQGQPTRSVAVRPSTPETNTGDRSTPWPFRQTDNLASVLGYGLVSLVSVLAYRQWKADQRWKRVDALMERIMAFGDTQGSRNAMMMLTSHDRDVPLFDCEKPEDRYVRVTWNEVARALIPGNLVEYPYERNKDIAIRDSFEDFFGRFAHLKLYLDAGLLSKKEAEHVVKPWVRRFAHLSPNPELSRNLRLYIDWRRMDQIQALFRRYGVDLTSALEAEKEALLVEIQQKRWELPESIYPSPQVGNH